MEQVQVGADGYIELWCAECGGQRPFEQPPCLDGHGPDCPEWACTGCGAAVLVGAAPQPVWQLAGRQLAGAAVSGGSAGHGVPSVAEPGPGAARQRYVA